MICLVGLLLASFPRTPLFGVESATRYLASPEAPRRLETVESLVVVPRCLVAQADSSASVPYRSQH
jgi:hypothetical protein